MQSKVAIESQPESEKGGDRLSTVATAGLLDLRGKGAARKAVLYAEDDTAMRELTTRMLTRAGYNVTAVGDGLEAWEALNKSDFDLLITDNDMPKLTGVEVVTKLRLKKMRLPIILASGSADFFSGEEYRWLEFTACLQKPFLLDKLLHIVGGVLNADPACDSRLSL